MSRYARRGVPLEPFGRLRGNVDGIIVVYVGHALRTNGLFPFRGGKVCAGIERQGQFWVQ